MLTSRVENKHDQTLELHTNYLDIQPALIARHFSFDEDFQEQDIQAIALKPLRSNRDGNTIEGASGK
jgi:hypothetical protein